MVPVTVTVTGFDVVVVPAESVARAVKATLAGPVALGVQLTEYGGVELVPILVVPAKNSTEAILRPVPAVALAVTLTAVPAGTEPVGAVIATVGAATTVVLTAGDDVAVVRLLSVTRAVSANVPTALGRQVAE
jgi:hypothetical protein